MGQSKERLGPQQQLLSGQGCVTVIAAMLTTCAALQPAREVVLQHGSAAVFWVLLVLTAFNPMPLLPVNFWSTAPVLAVVGWLAATLSLACLGNPMVLVEGAWRAMTEHFSLFYISVFGSALLHVSLTMVLNVFPVIVQNVPHLQHFKIQKEKKPADFHQWSHLFVHIFASQLMVQLPLITGQYFFLKYFQIPYDYDSMPGVWDLAWRLALALIVDDAWVYFGHRGLHDRRIYKYIHKVHHTYTAPFAPDAEYEHPIETVVLGVGFFLACMFFTNHLAFMWAWLYVRLLVTYDSHSGYDMPFNLLHLMPLYNGAREHDWHHQYFNGNYAPTFLWWDRLFGTSVDYDKHEVKRRTRDAAQKGAELEQRGDEWYAKQGVTLGAKAGVVDKNPKTVPFATCLVTGSEGMVGKKLVAMVASRGAKKVVCVDVVQGPTPEFKALAARCKSDHGTELVYRRADISSEKDMLGTDDAPSPFDGVEVVFHLAAIVGPYYKHEVYEKVNDLGARNVLDAFVRHGRSSSPNIALVDCSTPSTRYPPNGDINGLMEHEMVYQNTIHEYATTKARGEKAILDANGRAASSGKVLATCAVAPHQVYAPEDQLFLPSMIQTALSGKLRIFGKGANITSFTHADNIAHGCVVAGAKLWNEGAKSKAAAEFFVITDGGAFSFWDVVNEAVVACGMPSLYTRLHLSPALLGAIAYIGVAYTKLTGKFVKLTPFTLRMLLINRTFCTAKARHILGYSPVVSFEEGWAQTIAVAKERFATKASKSD